MAQSTSKKKYIVDLELLNTNNEGGCPACGHKFNLGDTAVMACGSWEDGCARLIHENEAVFDPRTQTYFEKTYYKSLKVS